MDTQSEFSYTHYAQSPVCHVVQNASHSAMPRYLLAPEVALLLDADREGVNFSIRPITTKTFRDSFAMHLVQHGVPKKVIQAMMGHRVEKSTEWCTQVMALDVTRQLGVRFYNT